MSSIPRGSPPAAARFEALVMPHFDALVGFARHRVGAEDDVEDLVQEVCLRAWGALDGLREDGRARAWLFSILRRLLSDRHRSDTRRRAAAEVTRLEAAHEELIASEDPGPHEMLLVRLSHERVRSALDQIPDDFAMAVALHDIAGFPYRDIAEILEVPLGTVMSRIHRGRRMLAGWVALEETNSGRAAVLVDPPRRAAKVAQP